MKKAVEQVSEFHVAGNVPLFDDPAFPSPSRQELRLELIDEEWKELRRANENDNLTMVADGIADMIYVLIGMALEYGIPIDKVFDEVHASNMTKFIGYTDRRPDGKIMKGPHFRPPQIGKIIRAAQRGAEFG